MKYDVIIIGGGLAGLTASIHLSKMGCKVAVVEKQGYPRHKVCGEYVSNEVVPYLQWLGITFTKPQPITDFIFVSHSGNAISGPLDVGGFGLSRYAMDHHLYQKAIDNGVIVYQENVKAVDFSNDEFSIQFSDGNIKKSRVAIGAFGKRSNIDQFLKRSFIQKKSNWLAVKGHFSGTFPSNMVGLYNFDGGYCGISNVENNTVNICYIVNYKSFKKHKNTAAFETEVLKKNPVLRSVLDQMVPLFEKPMTISQISFHSKPSVENHILMVGDTAGLIHPLCGNGMAMAIHSAKIAAETVHEFLIGKSSRKQMEQKYAESWQKHFSSRLRNGRLLSLMLLNKTVSNIMVETLTKMPRLFPAIIKRTHGPLIDVTP